MGGSGFYNAVWDNHKVICVNYFSLRMKCYIDGFFSLPE